MMKRAFICFAMAICFAVGGFACGGNMGADVKTWADKICACKDLKCADEAVAKATEALKTKYSAKELKDAGEEALAQQKRAHECHTKLKAGSKG